MKRLRYTDNAKELLYASKARLPVTNLLIALLLLTAALKFTSGLQNIWDVTLNDESFYLYSGVKIRDVGFPAAEMGPLYAFWYYLLSLLQPDRIELYFLNYKILTVIPPVLIFFLLRRYKAPLLGSVIISGFFLVSNANLPVWPKPAHFALIMILVFFIAASYAKRTTSAILLVCVGALLSSYVRPEFALAYLLLLSLYIVFAVRSRRHVNLSRQLIAFGVVASISALLLSTLGTPAFAGKGDRDFLAFSQHFSVNWVRWTGSDLSPWTDHEQIVSENFGDARSMTAALRNDPLLFLEHVTSNFAEGIKRLTILSLPNGVLSAGPQELPSTIFERYFLLGLLGLYIVYRLANASVFELGSNIAKHRTLLLLFSPFLLTAVASAIIIYPRDHYLLIPGILTALAVALLAVRDTARPEHTNYKQAICIGVLVVLLTPALANRDALDRDTVASITFLESLGIEEQVNMLEAQGGYHFYLGDNFSRVAEYEKNVDFSTFLEEKEINMVVVDDTLKQDSRFRDDEEWQSFLEHYTDLGYRKIDIPDTNTTLIVAEDII